DPDFGPRRIHPTAGATAVGARPFLVAFNIYLDTADVGVAKEIAKRIRTSSGGLPAVQASGFEVGGQAQVSMNLLDIDTTPPAAWPARRARSWVSCPSGLSWGRAPPHCGCPTPPTTCSRRRSVPPRGPRWTDGSRTWRAGHRFRAGAARAPRRHGSSPRAGG